MPQVTGDQNNNYLFGTFEYDEILGLGGNDYLTGLGGTDVLQGGDGNDTFIGGTAVLSQASISALVPPDTLESYVNSLKDTFTGGAGADRFVFSGMATSASVLDPTIGGSAYTVQYNQDLITDFTTGIDKIVIITSLTSVTTPSFTFINDNFSKLPGGSLSAAMLRILGLGEPLPVNADDFLIYNSTTGDLYYDSDGTVKGPTAFARLAGAPALSATDFEIIAANMITGTEGGDTLTGTAALDRISGLAGNDTLEGGLGDDILFGGNGINKAVYWGNKADYLIQTTGSFYVVDTQTSNGNEGMDTLSGIGRLQFQDVSVAYDLNGNAGKVAKLLGAVFGQSTAMDTQMAGDYLFYADNDVSYETLVQMALVAKLGLSATNRQVVDLLYNNITGSAPSESVAQYYVDMLDNHTFTQAALGVLAADTVENSTNIALTTLLKTGLVYSETPNKNVIKGGTGNDSLTGTAGADVIVGLAGNDTLSSGAGNDTVFGEAGVDKSLFAGTRAGYLISHGMDATIVVDNDPTNGSAGTDTLFGIERLGFDDVSIAFDLDANAGEVAKILGAVFGKAAVGDSQLAGIGLHYMDEGMSYETLMQAALNAKLGASATNRQVVDLLYSNVVGVAPSEADAQYYVGLLDAQLYTQGSLGVLAADTEVNAANIDLVGLSTTGLLYDEYVI